MLSRRLVSALPLRNALAGSRLLPKIQKRGLMPPEISDRKTLDKIYPPYPELTDAEDPDMVGHVVVLVGCGLS